MTVEIIRRVRNGILGETVRAWHHEGEGPGGVGGRTYDVLYAPNGRVRIDVSGYWSSTYHTIFLGAGETRPQEEYIDHLLATGQTVKMRAYCSICGLEKEGLEYSCPEGCSDNVEHGW